MVRRAFESEASIDLDPLWEVFVRNTAIPSMRIERHGSGQDIVVEGYSGPLPVTVRVGEKKLDLIVSGRLTIPDASSAARVELDPDGISLVTVSR
jgi:hypothetical protein